MIGSRGNTVLQRGKMESFLYNEVLAIRRDGLLLSLLPGSIGKVRLYVVGLHVDRILLPWAPYVSSG